MTSQMLSDSNGSGKLKWSFSDADDDFDFLAKNQTLVLTYDIKVSDNHGGSAIQTVKITVTGTDDKPVINMTAVATVTEQANQTLSLSPDTAHVALNFIDPGSRQYRPYRDRDPARRRRATRRDPARLAR